MRLRVLIPFTTLFLVLTFFLPIMCFGWLGGHWVGDVSANPGGSWTINLTWTEGEGASNTVVRGRIDDYPTNYDTDVAVYSGAGTSFTHEDLTAGDHWFYRAWSHVTEGGKERYSDAYAQADAIAGIPSIGSTCIAFIVFGSVQESSTYETGLDSITITNTGDITTNITIKGTDMVGGDTWVLSDTATPGENIFGLKAGLEGEDYTIVIKKNSPYNILKSNLEATQKFGIKFYTPTSFTDGQTKRGTITLVATAA